MKRIWHNIKIWLLISLLYAGFYLVKVMKAALRLRHRFHPNSEFSGGS